MHRYFFHTEDGQTHVDRDGVLLPDAQAAQVEAIKALCQLVQEHDDEFWRDLNFGMTVTDSEGLALFVLDLTAIFAPVMRYVG